MDYPTVKLSTTLRWVLWIRIQGCNGEATVLPAPPPACMDQQIATESVARPVNVLDMGNPSLAECAASLLLPLPREHPQAKVCLPLLLVINFGHVMLA